jgi:hypothetical protein
MKRKYTLTAIAVLVASTASFASYKYFQTPSLPDPSKQKTEDIAKLMASDNFSKLSANVKDKYLENLVNQDKTREIFYSARSMPDDERKNLRDNMRAMFEIAMNKKAKEYFDLPLEKREAFLDGELDKMADRRANRPDNQNNQNATAAGQGRVTPGGTTAQGNAGGRRGPSAKEMKQRIETTNPLDRAKAIQYRTALRARAQQRGQR